MMGLDAYSPADSHLIVILFFIRVFKAYMCYKNKNTGPCEGCQAKLKR